MGWDYIHHPKFLSGMQSARYYFEKPVLLKDVVALLAPERTGLPLIDYEGDPEVYRKVENGMHQWLSHQGRRAIAGEAFVNFVQLRFLSEGIKVKIFEGQLMAESPEMAAHYVSRHEALWCAHKITEPAMMRDMVSKFHAAVTQTFAQVHPKGQATVWLRHPAVSNVIEVDLDGNRVGKGGLRPSGEERWMPLGYDKPVQLSRRLLENNKKWQTIIEGLSLETRAKLFALAR